MATQLRWRRAPATRPVRGTSSNRKPAEVTPLYGIDQDRLGFDAWLLPPLELSRGGWWVGRLSAASGPVLLTAAAGLLVWLLAGTG
jgi:hypothetical protein